MQKILPAAARSYHLLNSSDARFETGPRPSGRLSDLLLISFLLVASFALILRIGLIPRNPAAGVAVVYAPWIPAGETMTRAVDAGARFVRFGGFGFIAVVMPDKTDYVERAFADSALLVVDPQVLAACLPARLFDGADAP